MPKTLSKTKLSKLARQARDYVLKDTRSTESQGLCGYWSETFASMLIELNFRPKIVQGAVKTYIATSTLSVPGSVPGGFLPHWWVEVRGFWVDGTGDQFVGPSLKRYPPIQVAPASTEHFLNYITDDMFSLSVFRIHAQIFHSTKSGRFKRWQRNQRKQKRRQPVLF